MYDVPCYKFNRDSTADSIKFANPEGYLKKVFDPKGYHSDQHNLLTTGRMRYMGWSYDFTQWLTKYIIKTQHGGLDEAYAPNKTTLRKLYQGYGKIFYIIEAPK